MIVTAIYLASGAIGVFAVIGATLRLEDFADEVRAVVGAWFLARAGVHRTPHREGSMHSWDVRADRP